MSKFSKRAFNITNNIEPIKLSRDNLTNPFKGQFDLHTQQEDIILALQDNDIVIVDSIAGSSKTCTQVAMAHNYPQQSLYLTFSKALADEAKEMFPDHVDCRTIHSLAYREKGVDISHKLSRPRGRYKNVAGTGSEISKYYDIPTMDLDEGYEVKNTLLGLMVKQTLAKYEASADEVIGNDHIPYALLRTTTNKFKCFSKKEIDRVKNKIKTTVIKYATKLWKDRINSKSIVLASHDTYVKMWALSSPAINTAIIYADEMQDGAQVFVDVLKQQAGRCKLVLVGDPDQNLYSWRFSVNGLDMFDGKKMMLGQSFRYGQQAADLSMKILGNGRKMVGFPEMDTQVGYEGIVDVGNHYVKLFRLNSTLLQEALELIAEGKKVNIHVDVQDYVKMLESAQALYFGQMKKVKHEEILPFDTWKELYDEAKDGGVLARIYNTVTNGNTEMTIAHLKSHENIDNPDVTLMTSHRAKGCTFDYVIIANDFESNYNSYGEWKGIDDAEKRLLYVAATRAKKGTQYNDTVLEIVEKYEADQSNDLISIEEVDGITVIGPPKGEQAGYDLQEVVQMESLRDDYANGSMSTEGAFEQGFIDSQGADTEYADFKEERILPFTEEGLDKELEIESLKLSN